MACDCPEGVLDAYFAGILDGEGSIWIGIDKNGRTHSLRVGITNADEPLLKLATERYGGSYHMRYNKKWNSTTGEWMITNNSAADVLKRLLPYLMLKKEQAEIGIIFRELLFPKGNDLTREHREKLWNLRNNIRIKLQTLHLRGGNPKKFKWINPYAV